MRSVLLALTLVSGPATCPPTLPPPPPPVYMEAIDAAKREACLGMQMVWAETQTQYACLAALPSVFDE